MADLYATNVLRIPKSMFTEQEVRGFSRALTYIPKYPDEEGNIDPVELLGDDGEYLTFPRAWAEENFDGFEKRYSQGIDCVYTKFPDPYHPAVKDKELQAQFMEDILDACTKYNDFRIHANTGIGKTVCALNTVARMGKNALIIVPTTRLAHQWKQEAMMHIGLTEDQIGLVQGPKCVYKNKNIVIAIINSLSMKDNYPEDFYNYFAFVIADESHRCASRVFSQGIPRTNSRWRIGLSATHKRKDGADLLVSSVLGPIRVTAQAKALHCEVIAIPYQGRIWAKSHTSLITNVVQDKNRNNLICNIINEMYKGGRQFLIVGDRIQHLQDLMQTCQDVHGIPRESMGQFTGMQYVDKTKKRKISQEELDYIKKNSQLIFATYNMMKEGVDIPRLDSGMDVTPRADATQLVGRVRRVFPNKPTPVWRTLVDVNSPILRAYYAKRKKEYLATNMTLKEL